MTETRTLVRETARLRVYEVRDDQGALLRLEQETLTTPEDVNTATLRTRAGQALTANSTYLALASPTNAQVAAQVTRLTRECSAVIRLLLGQVDDTADT